MDSSSASPPSWSGGAMVNDPLGVNNGVSQNPAGGDRKNGALAAFT